MLCFNNKIFLSFLTLLISLQFVFPAAVMGQGAYPMIAEFLCETGMSYYEMGMSSAALHEFKKALLANPESGLAKECINFVLSEQEEGVTKPLIISKPAKVFKLLPSFQKPAPSEVSQPSLILKKDAIVSAYLDQLDRWVIKKEEVPEEVKIEQKEPAGELPEPVVKPAIPAIMERPSVSKRPVIAGKPIRAEALPRVPVTLKKDAVVSATLDHLDQDIIEEVLAREREVQQELARAVILEKKKAEAVDVEEAEPIKKEPEPKKVAEFLKGTFINIPEEEEVDGSCEIEASVGEPLVMKGKNITRFLVTEPDFLKVSKEGMAKLLIEPKHVGTSYIHIWDSGQRKTFKFVIGPRRFSESYKEKMRRKRLESQEPESFKFGYSINNSTFLSGRRFKNMERQGQSYTYSASLEGETPVGDFYSATRISRTSKKKYKVSNLRMGIEDGHYGELKDIDLRWFDFSPSFGAFGFPSSSLRGAMLKAPVFDKKMKYTAFWGAMPEGTYTTQSGLKSTKEAWLDGIGIEYRPNKDMNFKTFYSHAYGKERTQPVLTDHTAGFGVDYRLGRVNLGADMVYDMQHVSYQADASLSLGKLYANLSMADYHKNFESLFGGDACGGSINGNLSLSYRPVDNVNISTSFSGNRSKVFGNPEDPKRPNYHSSTNVNWTIDPHTQLEVGYAMDDQKGSISPTMTERKEIRFRKKLFFFKKLNTYISYQNTKTKSFTSTSQNYHNNRILMGLNFRVIDNLYYYYNREFNILKNQFTGETASPMAQEMGLTYSKQLFDCPLYANMRIFYRDEQNTESVLSYLSGQDRLDFGAGLTFRPSRDSEVFLNCRASNIWAEKASTDKHADFSLNWGLRFLWDTGLSWKTFGSFDGFVFYDDNADGLRQFGEKGVKNVEIMGSEGRKVRTDQDGYYNMSKIPGRFAELELNLKTLPKGFHPTSPVLREVEAVLGKVRSVDFGIASKTEISGIVFNDGNRNSSYDAGEKLISGVIVILDDKEKTATNTMGEFMYGKVSAGRHILKLDLKSIPLQFIPKVPIRKAVDVKEGTTFIYNIPLEKS